MTNILKKNFLNGKRKFLLNQYLVLPKIVPLVMLWWNSRESVEKRKHNDKGTTSDFLIPISFQPNVIDFRYVLLCILLYYSI